MAHRAADRGRARSRARARDHPSRFEAREHQGPPGRYRESARLRPSKGGGSGCVGLRSRQLAEARGRAVDKRADIWAFGSVLYEMVTGRVAFAADTVSDTIVAVLSREPDWR